MLVPLLLLLLSKVDWLFCAGVGSGVIGVSGTGKRSTGGGCTPHVGDGDGGGKPPRRFTAIVLPRSFCEFTAASHLQQHSGTGRQAPRKDSATGAEPGAQQALKCQEGRGPAADRVHRGQARSANTRRRVHRLLASFWDAEQTVVAAARPDLTGRASAIIPQMMAAARRGAARRRSSQSLAAAVRASPFCPSPGLHSPHSHGAAGQHTQQRHTVHPQAHTDRRQRVLTRRRGRNRDGPYKPRAHTQPGSSCCTLQPCRHGPAPAAH